MTHTICSLLERAYRHWDNAAILTAVADELGNRNRLDYSLAFAKRAIELAPTASVDAYLLAAFACFRDPVVPPDEGNKLLAQGYEATGSGAARAWQAAVADNEEDAQRWLEEARSDSSLDAQIAVAVALSWRGKSDESYNAYCTIAKNFPADTKPEWGEYCSSMLYLKQQGKEVDVEGDILPRAQSLIAAHPDTISHRLMLMRCYAVMGKRDEALEECRGILEDFPDDETTMVVLAGMYEKREDIESAILWCNRAIGAKYSYAGARIRLAGLYEKQGNIALAEQVMREVPVANPRYAYGAIELAYFLYRHGKEEEARNIFADAFPRLFAWEQGRVQQHEIGKVLAEGVALDSTAD